MAYLSISKPSSGLAALSAFLILCAAVGVSVASPVTDGSSDTATSTAAEEVQYHIEQVLGGVEILIRLGSHLNGTLLDVPDFQNVSESHKPCTQWYNNYCDNQIVS